MKNHCLQQMMVHSSIDLNGWLDTIGMDMHATVLIQTKRNCIQQRYTRIRITLSIYGVGFSSTAEVIQTPSLSYGRHF